MESCWNITSQTASFECNGLQGEVSLADPSAGMSLRFDSSPIEGRLWSFGDLLGETVKPTETYIRGNDLVVAMPSTKSFSCETVWYFEVTPISNDQGTGGGATIRLTLSLQTDLLDTSPEVTLISTLPGVESGEEAKVDHARYLASESGAWTCFEVAHPSDLSECVAEREGTTESLKITLPFLEKGVIRRARVAAFFLSDGTEATYLQQAVTEFVDEPLPLTT